MSGDLTETHIRALTDNADQSSLSDFDNSGGVTTIAVVTDPKPHIIEHTDELMKPLGMPEDALNDFRKLRKMLNYHDHIEEHNSAYEKCNLDAKYWAYLEGSDKAQNCVDQIVSRIQSGEDIALVCFEPPNKHCHRTTLMGFIRREVDRQQPNKFADAIQ